MRFKSKKQAGFQVFAVTGINTVSFGIDTSATARKGLLGFAVERIDPVEKQRYFMPGFKVFPSVIPRPDESTRPSTFDHPVQSLVWDDFTAKSGRSYEYLFHPLRGTPRKLDRSLKPVSIQVKTEALYTDGPHDVFFNRGVASSQAYTGRFGRTPLGKLPEPKQQQAKDWLSRDLDDALLKFIAQAKKGDGLLCCFYEFRYLPVATALAQAITRGVDVRLIIDAKVNETKDKKTGKINESFPREDNLRMLKTAKIPKARVTLRESRSNDIQHNKFMVLLKGKKRTPMQTWTGSTNISEGGLHGQTNVGHWVRDEVTATLFESYWNLLKTDPGAVDGSSAEGKKENAALYTEVETISPTVSRIADIPDGITSIFSPRRGPAALKLYVDLVDKATESGFITLAFGINKDFKDALKAHTGKSPITFLLLEKKDKATEKTQDTFVAINASNNVYKAWGSYINDPVYQWAREINAKLLGLNKHVSYVHSKFLLFNPLGADPIVVTGSANFSKASTNSNDENMLLIRGDQRVADIYFTEFNRIFNHYYFRSVAEETRERAEAGAAPAAEGSLFLKETDAWTAGYAPGKLRQKRLALLTTMSGFN
ncbi:Phosphatidylserine/phosphatidylglycerophosphate/cardiolipin synthase [Polaromonas sp. YR568]|uniref:phospholipase D-like domain-containing protein n=1 Tax=Polaromonas sp. YR568 TaxID=1855301 RepID=UPI0008EE41C6|nr:phospholipase D-like domain-containing protein [Polaromonas sp. YR568]SFU87767.1 Phosphatidylserine/phosphatidylglycerophosphate/cardiolipin synthase [Polaromonas sp. YR568]